MTKINISPKSQVGNAILSIAEKYELEPSALADGLLNAAVQKRKEEMEQEKPHTVHELADK